MDNILSIHTGHDASIALWSDYSQIAISKEERLIRVKNWGKGFPEKSFQYVQNFIEIDKIDTLLLSRNFFDAKYFKEQTLRTVKKIVKKIIGKEEKQISLGLAMRLNNVSQESSIFDLSSFLMDYGFRNDVRVYFCNHHLAHALPALFFNPDWKNAMLYTSDGGGDGLNYSFTHFDGTCLDEIYGGNDILFQDWSPDSLGQMYGMVTEICGFKKNRHEGKITGLAAFGHPRMSNHIFEQYRVDENGRILPNFDDYNYLRRELETIYFKYGREILAASAQKALEELTIESIRILQKNYAFDNLGLSGGVCSNVRLNQKISELKGIQDLFVYPPMTDEGLVSGYVLDYLLGRDGIDKWLQERRALNDVYWGDQLTLNLGDVPNEFKIVCKENIIEKAADLLVENKLCALFTLGMEYGPRALGARSILINPSNKSINDTVNKRLGRTEFMPFAPVVLEEMVEEVFEVTSSNRKAMKFMTITTNVKKKWKKTIEATVHVDGTARPQIISRNQNQFYYDIVKAFFRKTGIPCLVNTSFNAHEEPIINSPKEALQALRDNRIDFLIFDNFIISK